MKKLQLERLLFECTYIKQVGNAEFPFIGTNLRLIPESIIQLFNGILK